MIDIAPVTLVDEGLGNTAYLVDLGDGRALAVDPSRDLRAVYAATQAPRLRVAFTAETHLHADFLSGARQLAHSDDARVLASAAGHRAFPHVGLREGDEVDLGGLRLRALATPGHTDEHLCLLLLDGSRPVGVFTGGSLLVGSAARTDLVDPDRTEELARAQYRSLQRLLELPDEVAVWPTHGAGSFCSAPGDQQRTTTIGQERARNPLLQVPDEDGFVADLTSRLGSYPTYFSRLAEVNRQGPSVLPSRLALSALSPDATAEAQVAGAALVDVRPVAAFSAGHVPGSLSIPLRPAFASWLGWLTPHDRPIVAVRDPDQDPAELVWQAAKIGHENLVGELDGGVDAWAAAGRPVATLPLVGPGQADDRQMLDVRQDAEFRDGHVPGSLHVELGRLAGTLTRLTDTPIVVACGHGERAMGAASMLLTHGFSDVSVMAGGPQDWAAAHGRPLEHGGPADRP